MPRLPLLPNSPFSPTFQGPSSWVNLFSLIILLTTLAKFRQNRHFCQIRHFRQHFGALLAGLIYSLIISPTTLAIGEILPKSPLSSKSPFSPNSPTLWGPSSWVNLFALITLSTTLAKFRQNRHFWQIRRFPQHYGALLAGLIYSL